MRDIAEFIHLLKRRFAVIQTEVSIEHMFYYCFIQTCQDSYRKTLPLLLTIITTQIPKYIFSSM